MTTLKTIPKATVNGAIKLARLPADTVLRAAPESVASSAGLAVDRADAAVRSAAGTALRDEKLRAEAKRLRQAVAERKPSGLDVTISLGVAAACGAEVTYDGLLGAADRALYDAKSSGRNAVRADGHDDLAPMLEALGVVVV